MLTTKLLRPTHVSHHNIEALCTEMRAAGRTELIHYAGACHRDDMAWQVCKAWLADRTADEAVLKHRAFKALGHDVPVADIRRVMALRTN